ncbi:MAG: dihydrodipicolinate synthase family protein [Trueperaceae bacterium]
MSHPERDTPALHGVYPILPTPFLDDGSLDVPSLERLIDYQRQVGVHGVAILGFMGEAHKLSEAERATVVRTVVERAGTDLAVWVGVRALGTAGTVEQAVAAEQAGASAVFVAPVEPQNDEALYRHFRTVAESISIPVVLHDYPASFGLTLSVDLVARLARDGFAPYIKAEDPPVLQKMTQVLQKSGGTIGVFGGLGGTYFLEELQRGAVGIMTGLAYPEVLLTIYDRFREGDVRGATEAFDRFIPYIRYEFQPKIGLAYRKQIYHRRGLFTSTHVRAPGLQIDEASRDELEAILTRVGLPLGPGVAEI